MKYFYNAERDRIATKVWEPCFIKAYYEDSFTKEVRALMLHTVSDNPKQQKTVATKYANTTETLIKMELVPRRDYERWLCGGDTVEIQNETIPASSITDYLIACDHPRDKGPGKYGDLTKYKMLLTQRDANLIEDLIISYELCKPEHNIVRDTEIEK